MCNLDMFPKSGHIAITMVLVSIKSIYCNAFTYYILFESTLVPTVPEIQVTEIQYSSNLLDIFLFLCTKTINVHANNVLVHQFH